MVCYFNRESFPCVIVVMCSRLIGDPSPVPSLEPALFAHMHCTWQQTPALLFQLRHQYFNIGTSIHLVSVIANMSKVSAVKLYQRPSSR
jgi:hypothetical protein